MAEKIIPQNIEAEKNVLGILMLDSNAIYKIVDFLTPEDFYKENHRYIFEAMTHLFTHHEPIDILSVSNRLEEMNKLEQIGGRSYLTDLINSVTSTSNIINYGKIIQKKKMLRDLIEASYYITELGYQEEEDIEELLDSAERKILNVSKRFFDRNFIAIKDALEDAFIRIDNLHKNDNNLRGVPTGFIELDNYLSGFQKSDLILLAARPAIGKTSLALNIAKNVASIYKIPVAIFSLEMSKEQLVDRFIASVANINLQKLRTGKLSNDPKNNDFEKISNSLNILAEAPIFIDDSAMPTVTQIRTQSRRLQAESGLGLIIIDYLQLLLPRRDYNSYVQQFTEISRALKAMAKELCIPVLALSQLSREVEKRNPPIPILSDLRESGSLEQDADVVLFLHREKEGNQFKNNIAEIHIAKHRNGPTGQFKLYFNPETATFHNLEQYHI